MKPNATIGVLITFVALLSVSARAQDVPPPVPNEEQPEVLTRGPVNEAFAEPVNLQSQDGLVVPNQPPADIEEQPPADRPQGDHYVWVPGYWGWDSDRNDFLWVSACWRAAPPGRYWVPGYWSAAAGGWEWVPGFWATASEQAGQEIEYLPAPPAPIDLEPPGPAPAADQIWVPGCWYWRDGRYVRRSGYWLRQQADWVWVPSHFQWTPRGYVFVEGHWDYSLERRGVLFAPVRFSRAVYTRPGYTYSPTIAIDIDLLEGDLFVSARSSHYYFGDYYDDAYLKIGIVPRFQVERDHACYDPIYVHDRWRFGQADQRWEETQRQEYDRRRADKDLRPARTFVEMQARAARLPEAQRGKFELAKPIARIAANNTGRVKFEQIKPEERQKITSQAADTHKFRDERGKWETPAKVTKAPENPPPTEKGPSKPRETHVTEPERVKVPAAPPVVGRRGERSDPARNVPERPTDEDKRRTDSKEDRGPGKEPGKGP